MLHASLTCSFAWKFSKPWEFWHVMGISSNCQMGANVSLVFWGVARQILSFRNSHDAPKIKSLPRHLLVSVPVTGLIQPELLLISAYLSPIRNVAALSLCVCFCPVFVLERWAVNVAGEGFHAHVLRDSAAAGALFC